MVQKSKIKKESMGHGWSTLVGLLLVSCGPPVTIPPEVVEYSSTDHVSISNTITTFQATHSFSQAASQVNVLARSSQSVALLSNNTILITGGVDAQSNFTRNTELIVPASGSITSSALLITARRDAASATLSNGWVLVTGGTGVGTTPLSQCEIFSTATGFWTQDTAMSIARTGHTLTALDAGTALVAGGSNGSGQVLSTAAIYTFASQSGKPQNPAPGTWKATGSLNIPRTNAVSVRLKTGDVLTLGGQDSAGAPLSSSELYSVSQKTWTSVGSLTIARYAHSAVLLSDGRVWVVGGLDSGGLAIQQSEIYDPVAKTWSLSQLTTAYRSYTSVSLQKTGLAWIAGGFDQSGNPITATEIFDPVKNQISAGPNLNFSRGKLFSVRTNDGTDWVGGGLDGNGYPIFQSELYDSAKGTLTLLGTNNPYKKLNSLNYISSSNQVLITGGVDNTSTALSSSQYFNISSGSLTVAPSLILARSLHTATTLSDGRILVTGGQGTTQAYISSAEIFSPSSPGWASAGTMNRARRSHQAVLVRDGRILVAGGRTATGVVRASEFYNPANSTWSTTGNMITARADAASVSMPDGKVLIIGGTDGTSILSTSEIFDPSLGTFSNGPTLITARSNHSVVISNGVLYVVGGANSAGNPLASTEGITLPITASSTFASGPTLNNPRSQFALQKMSSGLIVAVGGNGAAGVDGSSEILSGGMTGSWTIAGALNSRRNIPSSVWIGDDRIFFEGGETSTTSSTGELFSVYPAIPITVSQGLSPYLFNILSGTGAFYPNLSNILVPSSIPQTIQLQVTDQLGDKNSANFTFD